jgi:hypothetical protein|tara:strand:+ start:1379 stop:1849 length:471 start_codon:yes stop_codon:yes gene_type:complete
MSSTNNQFNYKVGLNNVGSYQVSGKPFASGSIDCRTGVTGVAQIDFPQVTNWVIVSNNDSANNTCRIGFSNFGVLGTNTAQGNRFVEASTTGSMRMDLKLSQLFLSGSDNVSVVAGLTFIPTGAINNDAVSPASLAVGAPAGTVGGGRNWSGSFGV